MTKQIDWVEVIIVGFVGGLAAGALGLAYRIGASPDNVLTFFGSALGSGMAVVGALWIDRNKQVKGFEQLLMSLVLTSTIAMRFRAASDKEIDALIITLRQGTNAFSATHSTTSVPTPLLQYGLQSCIFWMHRASNEMQAASKALQDKRINRPEFIERVQIAAESTIGPVGDLLTQKGIPKAPKRTYADHLAMSANHVDPTGSNDLL